MRKYNVGLVGCGSISTRYLKFARDIFSDYYRITAVADIDGNRAKARAEEFGIEKYGEPDTVYADGDIDIVLNITPPAAHEEVSLAAIASGKHVYSEKPLAPDTASARRIIDAAKKAGVRVACAPDTFLSAPNQTARKIIDDDWLGEVQAIFARCTERGNEFWHPDPDFFFKKGAGPMLDMGFYYFNIFVSLFGGVSSVQGMSKISYPYRTIKNGPRKFEKIDVEVPTYYAMNFTMKNGIIGTFINTMDLWNSSAPYIEIYGRKANLALPNPNFFKGDLLIKRGRGEWEPVPQLTEYSGYERGIGIADFVKSLEKGTCHRASAQMAYHVLDSFECLDRSCAEHRDITVDSDSERPRGLYEDDESYLW